MYIRVQAEALAETKMGLEDAAIALLDLLLSEYPESGEVAAAASFKGECLERQGRYQEALSSYRTAVQRMRAMPLRGTWAWLYFAWLAARESLAEHFDEALRLIEEFDRGENFFPVVAFKVQASLAFILARRGEPARAVEAAELALSEAARQTSGFSRHPTVGLITELSPVIHSRLEALARKLNGSIPHEQ